MIVEPKTRGFICTTAHPTGCFENVRREVEYVTLALESLPEGAEDILGQDIQWTEDENGELRCQVEAEQLTALEALAQEQGITAARSAGGEDGQYTLVLIQP